MRTFIIGAFLVLVTLNSFAEQGMPKQHDPRANSENFAIAINPQKSHALIVGRRYLSDTGTTLNFAVGTIELVKLSTGLSDPAFHESLDPAVNIIRNGDPVPSDAGVIYVNPLRASSNADCSSVAWVNDNEAWALCKQSVLSGTTTVNIPLFLVRIRPNETKNSDKVKSFATNIGIGPNNDNKNFYGVGSTSLLVDGNYLVVGGGVGSDGTDTKSFLAKFLISSEPPTTGWAPETMMKYGLVNNALIGLAKMDIVTTTGTSSYYVTLNRGGGKYFLGKHNANDLTDVSSSSGVVPGFFSSFQLPANVTSGFKLNAMMVNGSNIYVAGSYNSKALIAAIDGNDGKFSTGFNSTGVLTYLPPGLANVTMEGQQVNATFTSADLASLQSTPQGKLLGIGSVGYDYKTVGWNSGLLLEVNSDGTMPTPFTYVGDSYDSKKTIYTQGQFVPAVVIDGQSFPNRVAVVGKKTYPVDNPAGTRNGGFYQGFAQNNSGYLFASGVNSCLVVLPGRKFKPGDTRKDIKLLINGTEVTGPDGGALGYLKTLSLESIGSRLFDRNTTSKGLTSIQFKNLICDDTNTKNGVCSDPPQSIKFAIGGDSAFRKDCDVQYAGETTTQPQADLSVEAMVPVVSGSVVSKPEDKASSPIVKVTSTQPGTVNFFTDSVCLTPFASPGASSVSAGQELSLAVGPVADNIETKIYAQATAGGTLKSSCVLLGSYLKDSVRPVLSTALLMTDSPNNTSNPVLSVTGCTDNTVVGCPETSDVYIGTFKDATCSIPIDGEQKANLSSPVLLTIQNGIVQNADNTIYVRLKDLAGNTSINCQYAGKYVHDNIAPSITQFKINNGSSITFSSFVDLTLTSGPGTAAYCISNDLVSCQWAPLVSESITGWPLSSGYGVKTVYAKVKDIAGNVSLVASASISYQAPTVPGAPTNVAGTAGSGQVSLTWLAPASNGGSSITGYQVQYSANGGAFVPGPSSSTTSATVTGLTNGSSYVFKVAAVNAVGTGNYSASSPAIIPYGPPGAPTNITATPGNGTITISWTAPSDNGGSPIDYYAVHASPNAGASFSPIAYTRVTSITLTTSNGIAIGTSYVFKVAAGNGFGYGSFSSNSPPSSPLGPPGAPTGVTGTAGNAQVSLSWVAPASNGGSNITSYQIQYSANGGAFVAGPTSATTSATVTGLTNGTSYVFQVAAVNSVGTGSYSASSSAVIPLGVPEAPTGVVGTAGNAQVSLSWVAPASNGGSNITSYKIQYSANGGAFVAGPTSTTTSATVTGLVNGTSYVFQVAAVNSVGTGSYSASSAAAVPVGLPGAPTGVAGTVGNAQVSLTWLAPASTGGSAITSYKIQYSANGGAFVAGPTSTTTNSTVTGLTNGTSYVFQVAAVNVVGTGSFSGNSAVVVPYGLPMAPINLVGTPGDNKVNLTWSPPTSNGGSAITRYYVQSSADNFYSYNGLWTTLNSATIQAGPNGTPFQFRVLAENAFGMGPYSSIVNATPATVANAPTSVVGTTGVGQISLAWVAPTSNGGSPITDYIIKYSTNNGSTWSSSIPIGSTNNRFTVTGLSSGTSYIFQVAAQNSLGAGSFSTSSAAVTPTGVPDAPTAVVATSGNGQATITWSAPANNGGLPILDYGVQYSYDGGYSWTSDATTFYCASDSYLNGSIWGTSIYTDDSSKCRAAVHAGKLAAGTAATCTLKVLPGQSSYTSSVGGGSITSLGYGSWPASFSVVSCGQPPVSRTIAGLSNGLKTIFRVAAINANGTGNYSIQSDAITIGQPGVPTNVVGTSGYGSVSLSWTAPTSVGGSAISDYSVQYSSDNGSSWQQFGVSRVSCGASDYQLIYGDIWGSQVYTNDSNKCRAAVHAGKLTAGYAGTCTIQTLPGIDSYRSTLGGGSITSTAWGSWSGSFRVLSCGSPTTNASITGLQNGSSYVFRVAAVNSFGQGNFSANSSAVALNSGFQMSTTYSDSCSGNTSTALTDTNFGYGAGTNSGLNSAITVDLGASRPVWRIRVASLQGCGWGPYYTNGKVIQWSNDKVTWYNLVTISGVVDGTYRDYYPSNSNFRYLRVIGSSSVADYTGLGEFIVE